MLGLWASKCWVAGITSLTMIEGERESLVVVITIKVGVTGKKDTDGHQ